MKQFCGTALIIETKGEALQKALQMGTVLTNVYLRRLHKFCVGMNWLPWPLIPKRRWPAVRFKDKRAITWDERCRIVARELNAERKAFYQPAWYLGAPQSDLAESHAFLRRGSGRHAAHTGGPSPREESIETLRQP